MKTEVIKNKKYRITKVTISLLLAAISLITGCQEAAKQDVTPKKILETPTLVGLKAIADPPLEAPKKKEPYSQISDLVLEASQPNRELYNTLYRAIDNSETTVDISKFTLSTYEKVVTSESLYNEAGFQFYYLDRIKLNKDGNSVIISYREKGEEVKKNKERFYSRLSHLIYNVAPEDYSPLQKLFSVYNYITRNADYTDNMQDETTHTAYSILMKGKSICGGFASLGYYVLNRVGIKTDYISSEPHAWNMVEIDGKKYHTDITWGAGNDSISTNSLRTILMDDAQRKLGLDSMGLGNYQAINGFFRDNPSKPAPATDNSFKAFYDLYNEYALDIDNNKVYYNDVQGIKSMNLKGENIETVLSMPAVSLITFHGIIYFINADNQYLYMVQPGNEPEIMDDTMKAVSLRLNNSILIYKTTDGTEKTLNINPFISTNFDIDKSKHQQSVSIPRQQSFKFEITFSNKMNSNVIPKEAVTLVNKKCEALPIHMFWSEDARTLTVRPQVALDKESAVSLYVAPGILTSDGSMTKEMYDLTVNIK